jgi:hypothetical protein
MSYFFTAAFFTLISVFSFSTQAMTPDETQPLLGKTTIYFQSAGGNPELSDYFLTVTNEEGGSMTSHWQLSNKFKNKHYLWPIKKPTPEDNKTQGTTPNPKKQLIKEPSTIETFLFIRSHQQLTSTYDQDKAHSIPYKPTYQLINQTDSAPTKKQPYESDIAFSLQRLREQIEQNTPIDFTSKQDRCWGCFDHCVTLLAYIFGHSAPEKKPDQPSNDFYDGS